MKLEHLRYTFSFSGTDRDTMAARLVNTLLYTAMAETVQMLPLRKFVLLLTLKNAGQYFEVEIVNHIRPFCDALKSLFNLLPKWEDNLLSERIELATNLVHNTKASIEQGDLLPYTIELTNNICTIKRKEYTITIPSCYTSDVLVGLSAVFSGCILSIEHNGEMEYRDRLFIEYLDRPTFGQPCSFEDFQCNDENFEGWFLSPSGTGKQMSGLGMVEYDVGSLEDVIFFLQNDCRAFYKRPIFRGQRNVEWNLNANLFRSKVEVPFDVTEHFVSWCKSGRKLLSSFDNEQLLQVAQHYGMTTDLLDFSKNPLIACFFALQNIKFTGDVPLHNCAVYVVDADMLDKIEQLGYESRLGDVSQIINSYQGMFRDATVTGLSRLLAQEGVFVRDAHSTFNTILKQGNEILGLEYEERYKQRLGYSKVILHPKPNDIQRLREMGVTYERLFPPPNELEVEFEKFLNEYPNQDISKKLKSGLN